MSDLLELVAVKAATEPPRTTIARNGRTYTSPSLAAGLAVRFDVTARGCWQWRGVIDPQGYGRISTGHGRNRSAHRFAYELLIGPIPDELTLDHLCMNRGCINPEHLEPVTAGENMLRSYAIPTRVAVRRREPCKNGHPRTPENVYIHAKTGKMRCRACARDWWRARAAERRAEA